MSENDLELSDKERLYWLLARLSGRALRECGVIYSDGSVSSKLRALDAAISENIQKEK